MARARLLVACAGLLAAAARPAAPEPRAPPGNALPAGPAARPPEPSAQRARVDPRDAWMLFVRQSNKGANGKTAGRGRAKKLKGPQGPPGLRAPPGPIIPMEVLLKEFKLLLQGAVRQRERAPGPAAAREALEAGRGPALLAPPAPPAPPAPGPRRVEAAFLCRLRRDASVERRALHELGACYPPDAQGAFRRGPGLDLTSGRYSAPVAGFYALAASLHVELGEPPRRRGPARPRDRLRLLICIQSRCRSHAALEAAVGLGSSGELFTLAASGVLYLQTGQYASIFLDNASGSSLIVRGGSHFSAVLLGV